MDIRIRRIFRPFARVIALLLDRMNVTLRPLLLASLLLAVLGAVSFYFLYGNPWSDFLAILAIVFVFLSGLTDEITREFADIRQKKLSELEKVVLGVDRYMDIPVMLAAIYYLSVGEYSVGLWSLSLRIEDNLIISAVLLLGVYLVGRQRPSVPGWETRAERAFYLSAFMAAGYTHRQFPLYLLVAIFSLGVILYLASVYAGLKSYNKDHRLGYNLWRITRPIKYISLEIFWAVKNLASSWLRLIFKTRQESTPAEAEEEAKQIEYPSQGHNFTALVTDGNSSQPIANAKVILKNKETSKAAEKTTNPAGKSDFSGIAEGEYIITVKADGYKTEEFERFLSTDSGEVFALSRHSSDLSIVVTDADNRMPIGSSLVILKSGEKEFRSKTDNLGVAYFKELKLGSYEARVEASGYEPAVDKIDLGKENMKAIELKRVSGAKGPAETSAEHKIEEPTVRAVPHQVEPSTGPVIAAAKHALNEKPQISQVIGESALIRYDSKSKVEKAVSKIVEECISNEREVVIVSSPPRTSIYREKLRKAINSGKIKVINLAPGGSPPEANEMSMSNLRSFEPIFKEMSAGSVLIFEALSSLIIKEGGAVAYKFVSDAIQHFSAEGLCIVCLLDSQAHDEEEMASFEKLFVNLVRIEGDRFVLLN